MSGVTPGAALATPVIEAALAAGRLVLSEHEAKRVLSAYGVPVTAETLVKDIAGLGQALAALSFPVVLKIDSPDILHKTEAGLVVLGCTSADDARSSFERIMARAAASFPAAVINGVLVQEMVADPVAECIVGMKKDPQFGPTVMFGLGGIFVEVFGDIVLRVAPLSAGDAAEMIRDTKGYKLLTGARGRLKADVAGIEAVLMSMSRLALELEPFLAEIDINPLMVGSKGAWAGRSVVAADALVLLDGRANHRVEGD